MRVMIKALKLHHSLSNMTMRIECLSADKVVKNSSAVANLREQHIEGISSHHV